MGESALAGSPFFCCLSEYIMFGCIYGSVALFRLAVMDVCLLR